MAFDSKQGTLQLAQADTALASCRRLLERAAWRLRERCLHEGKVAAAKLDQAQLVSFDLALSFAELTGGEFAVHYARRASDAGAGAGEVEARFARLFAAESIHAIRGRLGAQPDDYGLAPRELALA